jgi:ribose 5-phosphate isomerase B
MPKSREKIAIASDHGGFQLKQAVIEKLGADYEWLDLGCHSRESCNYADFGHAVGQAISKGEVSRGIIICGSGIGISIAANRYAKVRAALCTDATMARLARSHNDANVLALGERIIGPEVAFDCIEAFLNTAYEGGRHQARVDKLNAGI